MRQVIEAFRPLGPGANCLCSSLESILCHMGYSYDEAEIYFLSNTMNSTFSPDGRFGIEDIFQNTKESYLGQLFHFTRCAEENFAEEMSSLLEKGVPQVCIMRAKDIRYDTAFSDATHSRRHVCALYGIDREKGSAYISDRYFVNKLGQPGTFFGETPLRDFLPAVREFFYLDGKVSGDVIPDYKAVLQDALGRYILPEETKTNVGGHKAWSCYLEYIFEHYRGDQKLLRLKCIESAYLIKVTYMIPMLNFLKRILGKKQVTESYDTEILDSLVNDWRLFCSKLMRSAFKKSGDTYLEVKQISDGIITRQIEVFRDIIAIIKIAVSSLMHGTTT